MAERDVDLFVIGAGSGGVRAARIAASHGARVMIAEEYRVGGTCVIRGCVPKKLLVYAARFSDEFEDAAGFGWSVPQPVFHWPTLVDNVAREVTRLEAAYTATLERFNVELVKSRAAFEDAHTVRLVSNGARVNADTILISTGAWPHYGPKIPGIEHAISSNEAFHLAELPRRIVIQGGGYIAVEFACIFAGLGSEVTLVYRGENILRGFDDDVREHLRNEMRKRGITVTCGHTVTAIEKSGDEYVARLSDGGAIDRRQSDVRHRPAAQRHGARHGRPGRQDPRTRRHRRRRILAHFGAAYLRRRRRHQPRQPDAGGDPRGPCFRRHGLSAAADAGRPRQRADRGVLRAGGRRHRPDRDAGARTLSTRLDVYKTTFRPMKATLSGRDTRSFMKLLVDGATDRVVGCHLVGPDAGELIQIVGVAVKMGATKADFDATMAVHPTAAEELVTLREKAVELRPRRGGVGLKQAASLA